MSPQQTAQIRLRLAQVAEQRAADQAQAVARGVTRREATPAQGLRRAAAKSAAICTRPSKLAQLVGVTDKPATNVKRISLAEAKAMFPPMPVTDKPAGNGRNAKKQADYRQRKGEALKTADAQRKRASRAKKAGA